MEITKKELAERLTKKQIKHGGRDDGTDRFIGGFTDLMHASDSRSNYGNNRDRIRQSLKIFNDFGFDIIEESIEAGLTREEAEEVMYDALYDSAVKYIATMDSDKYGKKLLGLVSAKPEEKLRRSAADVWAVVNGADFLWRNTGVEKFERAYALVEKALKTAYTEHDENAAQRLRHEFLSH